MSKLLSLRSASAVFLALAASVAQASEGPASSLEGASALYMLLAGVAGMVVVIWILTIIIGKINANRK
jgi:hypothetical protein